MIRITCTQCGKTLNIDDAFAGGVCRCEHCGTIQTVPKRRKTGVAAGDAPPAAASSDPSRTLYVTRSRTGSGLDELADALSASGASEITASSSPADAPTSAAQPQAKRFSVNRPIPLLAAAAVLLLLILLAGGLLVRALLPGGEPLRLDGTPVTQPQFAGTPLQGGTVIYLLDRGSATRDALSHLKDATLHSVRTLGPNRRFQIIFWSNGGDLVAYPPRAPAAASDDHILAAERLVDEVFAFGETRIGPALQLAVTGEPATIILATAKGWGLDDDFAETVLDIRGRSSARIHTFAIGGTGGNDALATIAQRTGGEFREISIAELRPPAH